MTNLVWAPLAAMVSLVLLAGCRINLWAGRLEDPYELTVPPETEPTPTPEMQRT